MFTGWLQGPYSSTEVLAAMQIKYSVKVGPVSSPSIVTSTAVPDTFSVDHSSGDRLDWLVKRI